MLCGDQPSRVGQSRLKKSINGKVNGQLFWEKKSANLFGLGRFFGSRPPRTFLFLNRFWDGGFASLKEKTLKEKKKRKRRRNVTVQGLKNHVENQIQSRSWTCFHSSSNFNINFIFFNSQSIKTEERNRRAELDQWRKYEQHQPTN